MRIYKERFFMIDFERIVFAFLIGGLVCVIAQLLIDLTKLSPARILVLYVCFGVLLGGVGLYGIIFDFAGAGISVPLIGFGGTVAKGVIDAVESDGLIGALTGPFTSSAAGCSAALVFGYLCALIFRGKPKRS